MRTHFFSPLTVAFLPVVLTLSLAFAPALPCDAQTTAAVLHESQPKGAVNDEGTPSTPTAAAATPDPTISPALAKQLAAMEAEIEQLRAELKSRPGSEPAPAVTPAVRTAVTPEVTTPVTAKASESTTAATIDPAAQGSRTGLPEKPAPTDPFAYADWTWLNGNPRNKDVAWDSKFFTPEISM